MHKLTNPFGLLSLFALLVLAACAPAAGLSQDDQIATLVAATLNANGVPPATEAPLDGEIPSASTYGACASSGQLSLAYVKDSNVWLWVQGGANSQLTNSGDAVDVRISADGCRIAYSRSVPNPLYDPNSGEIPPPEKLDELWVISSDGSGNQALANVDFFTAQPSPYEGTVLSLNQFEWQPGSYLLVFNTQILHEGVGQALNNDLYTVSADGGSPTTMLGQNQGGNFFFSPDGQQIAFSTPTSVSVINVDGSNLRSNLVTFPTVITYSEYSYYPPISWGTDSNSLMVAVPPEDGLAAPVNGVYPESALWNIPLDGTQAFQAGAVQNVWLAFNEIQFSPDNGRIAYLRPLGDPTGNEHELVIALSDGSNELPTINVANSRFGGWSPDSSQYIYMYFGPDLHLWLGNVNNENVTPISTLDAFPAAAAEVTWVEGSTFILVLHSNNNSVQLSVMDTSGAGVIVATMTDFNAPFDVAN